MTGINDLGARAGAPLPAAALSMALAVIALVVLMLTPPVATAASGADPSNPALDQYVESVPSSDGNHPAPPSDAGKTESLPPTVQSQIQSQGGSDQQQLEAVGGSPALGAPSPSATRKDRADGSGAKKPAPGTLAKPEEKSPSLLSSVATAATESHGDTSGLLIGGLVLLTVAIGGTALARRRLSSS
jgi:hypothetical protein